MKRYLIGAAAVALLACGIPASAQSGNGVAPIAYQTRTLPNGLRVYAIRDPNSSNVSVQVWYDVGSKDDPRGRSGFAHLFEHMMFKSTRNMVPEQFDRLTEDVGGYNNASTDDDYTNYYEVVPANHLRRLLWAEAERMGSLVVEQGFFASERDVVKEELRSRVLAAPYGRLFYLYLPQISYDVHPYGRPGIGSIEDLDAATIEDVRAFHASYYRPDNAVLVVAGNFDPAELDRWVDDYFAPDRPPGRRDPQGDGARAGAHGGAPLHGLRAEHAAPRGAASPFRRRRRATRTRRRWRCSTACFRPARARGSTRASSIATESPARRAPSSPSGRDGARSPLMRSSAAARAPRRARRRLRREIARFRDAPVSATELAEAKNELLTAALRERETVDGQASAIAEAVIVEGDAAAADRRLAAIAAVSPADIQRVARRWLRDESSAAIRYLPEEGQNGAREDSIGTAATVDTAALTRPADIAVVEPAPEAQRIAPPAPGPELVPVVPRPVNQRLANGLNVVTVPKRDLPLVSIALVGRGGAADDADGRAGTAGLTASVLTEGTATRSAAEIDRAVEALGASLASGAGWDGSQLGLTVRTSEADRALAIVADIARNAALAGEELERQRAIAIDAVRVAMSDPGEVASMAAMRTLYGAAPYGRTATQRTLAAITEADLRTAYRRIWNPSAATLILTGDLDPAQGLALAERHFGSWRGNAAPPAAAPAAAAPPRTDIVVIDMPGSGQAAVAVARNALARSDPRYYRAAVANAVLGGGYSARLNQEIRIRRGLSYGSGSGIDARRRPGPFIATTQTRNDAAAEVLGLILAEMRRLGAEPISAAELNARRASLTGDFGRDVETTGGVAGLIAAYVQSGLGPDEIERYSRAVLAVTPAEAQAAAGELLAPDGVDDRDRRRGVAVRRTAARDRARP